MRDVRFSMRETIEKFAPNAIKGFARGHRDFPKRRFWGLNLGENQNSEAVFGEMTAEILIFGRIRNGFGKVDVPLGICRWR